MALPILSNNPVIGEMSLASGTRIGENLARLGAQIGQNLEKKAIYEEAQKAAPELNSAYRNAFNLFQSGDTAGGFETLFNVSTKYAGNPLLSKMNEMAFKAGNEMSDAYMQRQMLGYRYGSGGGKTQLTPSEVDAQFETESDVLNQMPTNDEPDLTREPSGGIIPDADPETGAIVNDKMPVVQTTRMENKGPTQQQKIASMAPEQRAQASQGAIATDQDSPEGFETFDIPKDLQSFFMGATAIGLPKESTTTTSKTGNRSMSSRGTYSRNESNTETTTDPKVREETKKNFDAITKAAATLKSSEGITKAAKAAGGFQNLQRAAQRTGLKESNLITWPGNEKAIAISDAEMKAFDAIQSLPVTASSSGAKFFGVPAKGNANNVQIPRSLVNALKANPRDAQAISQLKEMFGDRADKVLSKIISQ